MCPAPLRTGLAPLNASGSSKPSGVAGGQKCWSLATVRIGLFVAVGVYETGFGFVRLAVRSRRDRDDRLAGGEQPTFPLAWVLWPVIDGQEPIPALATAAVLGIEEPQTGRVDREGWRLASSFGPVVSQGGVVRGRRAFDHWVSDDPGPGELVEVGAAVAVAEHPPVVSGLVELAEVPGSDPGPRLVRMGVARPFVGEFPLIGVQRGERLAGDHSPVVGGPSPDDRVELLDHRGRVGPAQGPQLGAQPFPDPSDGRLARLDQQLDTVPADVESEEVEALAEGDDTRLVLVERQTPGRQPVGEPRLDLERLLPGVTEGEEIVGLCRVASYVKDCENSPLVIMRIPHPVGGL